MSEIEYKRSPLAIRRHALTGRRATRESPPKSQITLRLGACAERCSRVMAVCIARRASRAWGNGIRMSNPIAYSPRAAAKAFAPPLSERLLRRMIREKIFKTVTIGRRVYLLHEEIVEALRELGSDKS